MDRPNYPRDTRKMTEVDRLCLTCTLPECHEYDQGCPRRIALGLPVRSPNPPRSAELNREICERHATGASYPELAKEYDLRYQVVWGIVRRGRS